MQSYVFEREPQENTQDFVKMNRRLVIIWLEHYQNFFGKMSNGLINLEELGKHSPSVPLNPVNFDLLDCELHRQSHKRLMRAVRRLKKGFPARYDVLHWLYLSDDPKPQLVSKWETRWEREGHFKSKIQLNMRKLAIDKMVELAGPARLTMDLPSGEGSTAHSRERSQKKLDAQKTYVSKLEDGVGKTQAATETAMEHRVARSTLYIWINEIKD